MMRSMIRAGMAQAKREGRFLGLVFVVAIFGGLFVVQPLQRIYDDYLRPRPFMTAVVELVASDGAAPDVLYAARSDMRVKGRWSAWVEVKGRRGCGGSGEAGYGPPLNDPRLWAWRDWLGADCAVPVVPFAVCVRYAIESAAGAADISGPFCSAVYDPESEK